MTMKISSIVTFLVVLAFASSAQAQHNPVQSSISGQYSRLIRSDDRSANPSDKASKNAGSPVNPPTKTKNSN